jgi:ketosteroid isomerase-like protein
MSPPSQLSLGAVCVGPMDPEIVAVEEALRHAQLSADVAALDTLIADDLLFTGPDGQLATKAQDLASHASGQVRFLHHVVEELRIRRVSQHVALTAMCTQLSVNVAGTVVTGRFRYTRTWAREPNGPWRVVGGHVSAV